MTEPSNVTLVSVKEICKLTSLSRTMINNLRRQGEFPKAILLGQKRVLWPRHEIDAWIAERARQARVS